MPVCGAVCCYNSMKVFAKFTAIIGEDFEDWNVEHVLHSGKE